MKRGRFPVRVVYLLLFSLILFSIAFRYPLTEHERNQTDSYFIHRLTLDICADGHASWTSNPLSYLGLYPLSYPSGAPFVYSELSCLTGMSIEGCILVSGILIGLMLCIVAFCLIRHFVTDVRYVLLATFFTVSGARFIDSTYWVGSGRALIVVFLLFMVAAFYMAERKNRLALHGIGVVFLLCSFAIHHMAILVILFGVAYLIMSVGRTISTSKILKGSVTVQIAYFLALIVLMIYAGFFATPLLYSAAMASLRSTSLIDVVPSALSIILNAGISFTQQIGFIFPIAVIGIPYLVKNCLNRQSGNRCYLISLLLVFIPFIGYAIYVSMLLSPFICSIGVLLIHRWFGAPRCRKSLRIIVLFLIFSSCILPQWAIDRWNSREYFSGDVVEVDSLVFNDASYLQEYTGITHATSNVATLQGLLGSISGTTFIGSGMNAVWAGEIDSVSMSENISSSDVGFPRNLYVWFEYDGIFFGEHMKTGLMTRGTEYIYASFRTPSTAHDYLSSHSNLIVVIDNKWPEQFVTIYGARESVFPSELRYSESLSDSFSVYPAKSFESYKLYSSSRSTYYLVQLPVPST